MEILKATDSEIQEDHADRPLGSGDRARIWRHASLDDVELFYGSYRKYEFARHFHRVPAIGVVERGAMNIYCRRSQETLGTGDVLLFNAGEIHAPAAAAASGYSFRMFYLNEAFLKSISPNVPLPVLRFKKSFVRDRELASDLFRLHVAMESSGERILFESQFTSIFSRLAERYSEIAGTSSSAPKTDKATIRTALEYMETNRHRNLSLAELAALSSYSAFHFLRVFKEHLGLTPHTYLTQLRVEMATTLLRSGSPLADVAGSVGFTDQSHLTKRFKRILGITPGQYASSWA